MGSIPFFEEEKGDQEQNSRRPGIDGSRETRREWVESLAFEQNDQSSTPATNLDFAQNSNQSGSTVGNIPSTQEERGEQEQNSQDPEIDSDQETPTRQIETDPNPPKYLLLCIKQAQLKAALVKTVLIHKNIKEKHTDKDTFISIRETYRSQMSSWWRLNAFSHVEFKKVNPLLPSFF